MKRLWNDIPALYDRLIISVQEVIDKLEKNSGDSSKFAEGELEVLLRGWKAGKDRIALQRKSLFKGNPSWKPLLLLATDKANESDEELMMAQLQQLPKDAASWMALIESQDILPVPQQLRNFGDHWTQTPWLHGEIYMSILHWHVLQHAIRTTSTTSSDSSAAATWSVDGITSSALPTNNIKTVSTTNEPTVEVSQTPAIDVYATEKDTAINAFALTHIFPMVAIVFADIELTKEAIIKQDGVALRALVTSTVESLLMACTWGNAVDLAMFSNEELAARHLNDKKKKTLNDDDEDKDDDKKHQCESSKLPPSRPNVPRWQQITSPPWLSTSYLPFSGVVLLVLLLLTQPLLLIIAILTLCRITAEWSVVPICCSRSTSPRYLPFFSISSNNSLNPSPTPPI